MSWKSNWIGQVFAVIHNDNAFAIDKYWHFHVNREKDTVPTDQEDIRLQRHTHWVMRMWGHTFKEGGFTSEIHTEDGWNHRERDIQHKWHEEQVKGV